MPSAPDSALALASGPSAAPGERMPSSVRVLIIGAGFGGLGMAAALERAGETDYVMVERALDVGGTWRDNTYPGAACDVPSQLYSFSFALNPTWSRSFSPRPEIQAYLQSVARISGVLPRCRLGVSVLDATWHREDQQWHVRTSSGECRASVLVSAAGALSEPKLPDIEGLSSFAGEVFHSAQWPQHAVLAGRRVAVIGTGASAVQIVPEIARVVAHLDVYQRTPPWVVPRRDRLYTKAERLAFRWLPGAQRVYRTAIYWGRELLVPAFTVDPRFATMAKKAATANLNKAVADPELRRRLTPSYEIGCKRILLSNDWYPALTRDNVELVCEPIAAITPRGVVTADGTERPVDVLVVATGFHTTDLPIAKHITGEGGETLASRWERVGMSAYKGSTTSGFPNLFFLVGPNTGLGHSSMVVMIEAQIRYVMGALCFLRKNGLAALEPQPQAERAWNDALQRRMRRTVWSTGGCSSWYLDKAGRNVTLWPRTTVAFRRLTARFDAEHYSVSRSNRPVSLASTDVTHNALPRR